VQEIDRAAGQMFKEVGRPELCGMFWPAEALAERRAADQVWVITGLMTARLAFWSRRWSTAACTLSRHQLTPAALAAGLGRMLLDHAAPEAAAAGLLALMLRRSRTCRRGTRCTTRGAGSGVLDDTEVTAGLRAIRQREAAAGLERWQRVCMRRDV
jgi:hypothetical protein